VTRIRANRQHQPTARGTLLLMTIRVGVQADTQDECVEGLELLVRAGFVPVMLPKLLTDNRWMARAVPAPPVDEPSGQ
jgi:hypothetical protein